MMTSITAFTALVSSSPISRPMNVAANVAAACETESAKEDADLVPRIAEHRPRQRCRDQLPADDAIVKTAAMPSVPAFEQDDRIDHRSDGDEEHRDQQSGAIELDPVHELTLVGHLAIERGSSEEGADDRFDADDLRDRGRREQGAQHVDVTHHPFVADRPEEAPRQIGTSTKQKASRIASPSETCRTSSGPLAWPVVVPETTASTMSAYRVRDHCGPDGGRHGAVRRQPECPDDRILHQRVRREQ